MGSRALSADLLNWTGPLHGRLQKPISIVCSEEKEEFLKKFLLFLDANRFNAIKMGMFLDQETSSSMNVDLSTLLLNIAISSYHGDIRVRDAISLESDIKNKMKRHIQQNLILWLADYMPLLNTYSGFLGATVEGLDTMALDTLLKEAKKMEDQRFETTLKTKKSQKLNLTNEASDAIR